jgi:hypothetical protein
MVRASTQRQGHSGLGGELVGGVLEIESGRKGGKARPELILNLAARAHV